MAKHYPRLAVLFPFTSYTHNYANPRTYVYSPPFGKVETILRALGFDHLGLFYSWQVRPV